GHASAAAVGRGSMGATLEEGLLFFVVAAIHRMCLFFFSSRRRHTRSTRDWSSTCALPISRGVLGQPDGQGGTIYPFHVPARRTEIGRASCRERVEVSGGAESFRKERIEGGAASDEEDTRRRSRRRRRRQGHVRQEEHVPR